MLDVSSKSIHKRRIKEADSGRNGKLKYLEAGTSENINVRKCKTIVNGGVCVELQKTYLV